MKKIKKFFKKMLNRILKNQGSSFLGLSAAIITILKYYGIDLIEESTLSQIMSWLVVILGLFFGQNEDNKKEG